MSDFINRLRAERVELDDRISKLADFLPGARFAELGTEHQELLRQQLAAMQCYSEILERRLALLAPELANDKAPLD
jgi:hypothetical protein